jgi:hypothetical protein
MNEQLILPFYSPRVNRYKVVEELGRLYLGVRRGEHIIIPRRVPDESGSSVLQVSFFDVSPISNLLSDRMLASGGRVDIPFERIVKESVSMGAHLLMRTRYAGSDFRSMYSCFSFDSQEIIRRMLSEGRHYKEEEIEFFKNFLGV